LDRVCCLTNGQWKKSHQAHGRSIARRNPPCGRSAAGDGAVSRHDGLNVTAAVSGPPLNRQFRVTAGGRYSSSLTFTVVSSLHQLVRLWLFLRSHDNDLRRRFVLVFVGYDYPIAMVAFSIFYLAVDG